MVDIKLNMKRTCHSVRKLTRRFKKFFFRLLFYLLGGNQIVFSFENRTLLIILHLRTKLICTGYIAYYYTSLGAKLNKIKRCSGNETRAGFQITLTICEVSEGVEKL